jgi:hypothetical protein
MSEVGGEVREEPLHILPFVILSDKSNDGEGVAEIV